MVEGVRWSVMQRLDLYFSEWFLSDTSSSGIPYGVSASSVLGQDSHHSIANSENIRNSSIVTLRSHLFLEWGISQMPSMNQRFLTSDHDSRSSSMSSTSLVNLFFQDSKIPRFQEWYVTDWITRENINAYEEFYLCGSPAMVKDARARLEQLGIEKENIYWEQF